MNCKPYCHIKSYDECHEMKFERYRKNIKIRFLQVFLAHVFSSGSNKLGCMNHKSIYFWYQFLGISKKNIQYFDILIIAFIDINIFD